MCAIALLTLSFFLLTLSPVNTLPIFSLAVQVILRLSVLPGPAIPGLVPLLAQATDCLKVLENTTMMTISSIDLSAVPNQPRPPHQSVGLHESYHTENELQVWGKSVEALWRVSMTLEEKSSSWDILTTRLLIWRAVVGEDGSELGEWARRELLQNILQR